MTRFAAFALAWGLVASPALADPVFPGASRAGLEPPPGMVPATRFQGFQDEVSGASITIAILPPEAYAALAGGMNDEALARQGIAAESRGTMPELGAANLFVAGTQAVPGGRVGKWILVAQGPGLTALVTVNLPPRANRTYTPGILRAALATLAFRGAPSDAEALAALPFTLGDLAGFRFGRALGGSAAVFTDGTAEPGPLQPLVVVASSVGRAPRADEHATFGARALRDLAQVSDPRIERDEVVTRDGATWSEIVATATDTASDAPVIVAQSIRFAPEGYLRVVAIAPLARREAFLPRAAKLRDGLAPR